MILGEFKDKWRHGLPKGSCYPCVRVTWHLRETVGNPAKAVNGAICREEIQRPGLEYKVIITVVNF